MVPDPILFQGPIEGPGYIQIRLTATKVIEKLEKCLLLSLVWSPFVRLGVLVSSIQHNLPPNTEEDDHDISDCESDVSDSEDTKTPTPRQLEEGNASSSSSTGTSPTSTRCPSPSKIPADRIKVEVTNVSPPGEPEDDNPCLVHGLDPSPLPPKKGTRLYRYLRWNFGSVYRRIFCLSFLGNLAALCVLVGKNFATNQQLTYIQASTAVTANILAAILVRNEHVVNTLFWVFGTWSARMPLSVRTLVAKVYSYGGIHSGCAVAGTGWFIVFLILMTFDFAGKELTALRGYIYFCCYLILALLVSMLITAHPHLRRTMHNWFEGVHRFMGWLAVLLFWAQVMLLTAEGTSGTEQSFGKALLVSPNFWMLAVITGLIVYPWTRLRMREVEAEVLSPHCVKLNFDYRDVYYGQAVRLTDAPLKETHAFGVIPHPYAAKHEVNEKSGNSSSSDNNSVSSLKHSPLSHAGDKGYSVIVSNAGDWTKKIINNPPKKIYTRGTPQFGVMRVAGLFEPCIVVATGSGIAPCLSLFVQRPDHPVRIIWSTKKPMETYGKAIIDLLYQTDPRAIIIDTSQGGPKCRRPDLVKVAYRVYQQSQNEGPEHYENLKGRQNTTGRKKPVGKCEAVVIISNQRLTEKVVYGLESRGVPAYGALFDS
ncbi:putative NRPS-like enzyme [Cladorrhinum sp. PSN332]|nr:putative NRPS-like enzyme [Cladorrhinum sp. PSN332]